MASTMRRRRRSRRGEGDRLREEILEVAERLLIERGSEEAVSIRAIADAVGVTPPSIYLHFPDKEDLFVAICDARFEELNRRSQAAADQATDPMDEVRRRGEAYIRFGVDNPEQYRILFLDRRPRSASPDLVGKRACLERMVEAVQRAMDAGMLVGDDAFSVSLALWAAAHGLTSLLISMPEFPWPPLDMLVDRVLDMCTVGIAPR
jgi:AcrR family transcriptional regulator